MQIGFNEVEKYQSIFHFIVSFFLIFIPTLVAVLHSPSPLFRWLKASRLWKRATKSSVGLRRARESLLRNVNFCRSNDNSLKNKRPIVGKLGWKEKHHSEPWKVKGDVREKVEEIYTLRINSLFSFVPFPVLSCDLRELHFGFVKMLSAVWCFVMIMTIFSSYAFIGATEGTFYTRRIK